MLLYNDGTVFRFGERNMSVYVAKNLRSIRLKMVDLPNWNGLPSILQIVSECYPWQIRSLEILKQLPSVERELDFPILQ